MYKGSAVVALAKEHLGERGAEAKAYCRLSRNANYCDAFVTWLLYKNGVKDLYCGGTKQIYCPTSIKWCYNNLASLPPYLALPGDIIFFDWEPNGKPNHVGIVRGRDTAVTVKTIEGNTSKQNQQGKTIATGVIANKNRTLYGKKNGRKVQYIQAIFRPHYTANYDVSKPLEIDGKFGFDSIAMLQTALGITVSGIFNKGTVKALQKKAGADADGDWGVKTSKAVQTMLKKAGYYTGNIDGDFGTESVKALQKWINDKVSAKKTESEVSAVIAISPAAAAAAAKKKKTGAEKVVAKADELAWKKGTKRSKYAFNGGAPTAAFKKAFNKVFSGHYHWGKGPRTGASCDVGAATIIRASGLDTKMPRGYSEQVKHKPSAKMKKIVKRNVKPYAVTKAGDMILYTKNASGSKRHVLVRGKDCLYEAQYQRTYLHVNKSMAKIKVKRPKVIIFRPK